ncbi:hypothetical protein PGTUg99_017860 [Puccinia graminis f. sp. tritici]|uniref:Uncharacterized protein n=1 Tax=Puccinia graminis f. sp. tritici TaxID=56615 RepID=A0A5B0MWI3_PUCGR|nr:hypothetical protein PGTUg99_017860 [Puccinia graminis f. sp. tritici]
MEECAHPRIVQEDEVAINSDEARESQVANDIQNKPEEGHVNQHELTTDVSTQNQG